MYGSYNRDIERVLSERSNFNVDSHNNYDDDDRPQRKKRTRGRTMIPRTRFSQSPRSRGRHKMHKPQKSRFGEITGHSMRKDRDDYDQGMPMRPQCTFSKPVYDQNTHMDFDLFDKKFDDSHEIEYNDPDNNDLCSISRSIHTLSDRADPLRVCIDTVSSLALSLHNTISLSSKMMFNVNSLGLYIGFLTLYYGSTGNTEVELKSYFDFVGKQKTYDCMENYIDKNAKFLYPQVTFRTYILYDKEMFALRNFKKYSSMVPIIPINMDNIHNETKKLNKIIRKETGSAQLVSVKTMNKVELDIISVIRINPIWGIKVDSLSPGKFMGDKTVFINFKNCNVGLYNEPDIEILEIPMEGKEIVLGIVRKSNPNIPLDLVDLDSMISRIKLTNVGKLSIPKIVKRTKLRLNRTLQATGIQACFFQTELPDIFPDDDNRISDVVQYCDLVIDEKCRPEKRNNRRDNRLKKTKSITINNEFTYYIRHLPTDMIMSSGLVTI